MYTDRLRARSRERLRDRLPHYRSMLLHIVIPNKNDRAVVPLPRLVMPLYYLIRPIRLIHKHTTHLFRSGRTNSEIDTLS